MSSRLLQTDKVLHLVTEYTEFGRENNLFFKKKALTVMDFFFNLKVYENMRKGPSRASKNMLLWIKPNLLTDAMM